METHLTVKEIEYLLIYKSGMFNVRYDVIIPNLSWGLLNHEADLAIVNKTGYLTEIEIKRSLADLRADFKKDVYHCDERVYQFYYCLPLAIKDKAFEVFDQHQDKIMQMLGSTTYYHPAIIFYDENGRMTKENPWAAHKRGRKLFLEERLTVARLASCRYWDLRKKLYEEEHSSEQTLKF